MLVILVVLIVSIVFLLVHSLIMIDRSNHMALITKLILIFTTFTAEVLGVINITSLRMNISTQ